MDVASGSHGWRWSGDVDGWAIDDGMRVCVRAGSGGQAISVAVGWAVRAGCVRGMDHGVHERVRHGFQ